LDLLEEEKVGLKLLGTKINERLRFEKPTVYVERIIRPEYVRIDASQPGIISMPTLPSIVEGCKYDRIEHQSCNAHARRGFVKAQSNNPVLASQMIAFYQQLYAVEYRGALLSSAVRLELRQRDAVPTWQRMAKWLEQDEVKRLLPKSEIAQAVGYLCNQWSALQLYLKDGSLPIDNNQSERVIRPLTIGRKASGRLKTTRPSLRSTLPEGG